MLAIARQLQSEKRTVIFASPAAARVEETIAANGFRSINIRPSLSTLGLLLIPLTSGYLETFLAARLLFSGLSHYARATRRILAEWQPDAVVSDFAFPGACLAAEAKHIPYVVIYHAGLSFKGPGIPPFGSGLPIGEAWGRKEKWYRLMSDFLERSVDGTITRARRRFKLLPRMEGCPAYLSSPWLNLVLTAEASEAPRFPLPRTVFFVGPCFAGRRDEQANEFPFEQLSTEKPKVYVSLGTVFNKKPNVFRRITDAFSDGRYQLIVSAGGAYARLRSQGIPSNVLLFERVPQVDVLSEVDVVISHGGNNTVNETLAAGKPLLVMPVGGEQGDNASRVVYLGVGLRADVKRATSHEIGAKIDRLLEEPTYRRHAEEIAAALAQTQGPATAAGFIEHVARTKRPLLRPDGYPLTVTRETGPPWDFKGI